VAAAGVGILSGDAESSESARAPARRTD